MRLAKRSSLLKFRCLDRWVTGIPVPSLAQPAFAHCIMSISSINAEPSSPRRYMMDKSGVKDKDGLSQISSLIRSTRLRF
jgi:hypothetical protein